MLVGANTWCGETFMRQHASESRIELLCVMTDALGGFVEVAANLQIHPEVG